MDQNIIIPLFGMLTGIAGSTRACRWRTQPPALGPIDVIGVSWRIRGSILGA